jgi:hypothetical protein
MTVSLVRSTLLLAVALAGAAQAAGAQDTVRTSTTPFSIEDVDLTRDCEPNAALVRMFSMFGAAAPDADAAEWAFDEPLYNAVSGDVSQVLRLDDARAWHGLHLAEVRFDHGIERGPVNYTLAFEDSPERVREVWNARGWELPPVGETREVEGLEGYASVGVEADRNLATVTCYRD